MAKHALLVGVNRYANSQFNLRGCVNDVESLARLLSTTYSFSGTGEIEFLKDSQATQTGIMGRLTAMLSAARSGDTLVFAFSGHGTQIASKDPAEPDLKDECLVPYEGSYGSLIKDGDLFALFNQYVDQSIKFTAIYDCCHSGNHAASDGCRCGRPDRQEVINRCLPIEAVSDYFGRPFEIGPYNVLSACRDEQTAADVREAGPEKMARGAFSYALHNMLTTGRDSPIVVAEAQIQAGIGAVTTHPQTPSFVMIDQNSPLIRY
ncbi:hypothetical protein BH09PSE1_BH09PSE1_21790 [soil metagenome]